MCAILLFWWRRRRRRRLRRRRWRSNSMQLITSMSLTWFLIWKWLGSNHLATWFHRFIHDLPAAGEGCIYNIYLADLHDIHPYIYHETWGSCLLRNKKQTLEKLANQHIEHTCVQGSSWMRSELFFVGCNKMLIIYLHFLCNQTANKRVCKSCKRNKQPSKEFRRSVLHWLFCFLFFSFFFFKLIQHKYKYIRGL